MSCVAQEWNRPCDWRSIAKWHDVHGIDYDSHREEWTILLTVTLRCVECATEKTVCFSGLGEEV